MRYLKPAFLLVATTIALAVTWLAIEGVAFNQNIAQSDIKHEIGHAYIVPVKINGCLGIEPIWHRRRVDLRLSCSRISSCLARRMRCTIQFARSVRGHIPIGATGCAFSSSDNSNPQTNGRPYSLRLPLFAPDWLLALSWLLLAVAILLNPVVWRQAYYSAWLLLRFIYKIHYSVWLHHLAYPYRA